MICEYCLRPIDEEEDGWGMVDTPYTTYEYHMECFEIIEQVTRGIHGDIFKNYRIDI